MTRFEQGFVVVMKTAGIAEKPQLRRAIARSYTPPVPEHPWASRPWEMLAELMRQRVQQAEEVV